MLEGMLDNLSQPVAFASAPLVPPEAQAENGVAHMQMQEGSSGDKTGERDSLAQRASDLFASAIHATKPSTSSPIGRAEVSLPAEDEDIEELLSDRGERIARLYIPLSNNCRGRHGRLFLRCSLRGLAFHEEVTSRKCDLESGTSNDENTTG